MHDCTFLQTLPDDGDDNIYEMEPEVRDEPEKAPPQVQQ